MKHFPLSLMQRVEEFSVLELTGSRYFGTATKNSDYDFIVVTNQEPLKAFLKQFVEESSNENEEEVSVKDISSIYIKRKTTLNEVWRINIPNHPSIDLQFCLNVDHKLEAQAWIKAHLDFGFEYPRSPSNRLKLWEAAFKATEKVGLKDKGLD